MSTFEREQIPDGVPVLGAIQAMDRRMTQLGDASAALSMEVSRWATRPSSAAGVGRGMPAGGIWPPRTLRMTFSQVSAPAGMFDIDIVSSARPPVLARWL